MMFNFTAMRYLFLVRKNLPCSGRMKRRIMGRVRHDVLNHIKENPSIDLETLIQRIGSPRDIAVAYLEERETGEILISLNSRRKWIVATLALVMLTVYVLFGDTFHQAYLNAKISEDVKAVLNASMNTPNEDLFTTAMMYSPSMSEEEKQSVIALQEQINGNWEDQLGEYFSPGAFDLFLNSYIRTMFFVDDPTPSELVSMDLVSADEVREVLEVQVKVGYKVQTFEVTFMRNPDGLLYRVEITESE